jgi:hypothetical protein
VNQRPLGVDKLPASLGEFVPSISLGERNSELGLKLVVNRLVVADNGVDVLVWLASGVGQRMDRGGHPAGHHPVVGRAPSCVGDQVRSAGHHADAKDGSGSLTSRNQLDLTVPAVYLFRMLLRTRRTPPGFIQLACPPRLIGTEGCTEIARAAFLETAMANQIKCAFCGTSADTRPRTGDALTYTCSRCGNYRLVDTAEQLLRGTIKKPGAVSGWIRRQNSMGITPHIGGDVAWLRTLTKPPFRERVERYLVAVADKAQTLDQWFKVSEEELIGVSYSDHINDLVVILDYLREEGLMTSKLAGQERLTAKGYIAADDLRAKRAASSQAFVAMWFTNDMKKSV